jgi:hypothetical protein
MNTKRYRCTVVLTNPEGFYLGPCPNMTDEEVDNDLIDAVNAGLGQVTLPTHLTLVGNFICDEHGHLAGDI